jgi:hypothetical protein
MHATPFPTSPSDLRKTPRTMFRRPAMLHLDPSQSVQARTIDISLEGLCIAVDLSLPAQYVCAIEFNASFTEIPIPLRLEARVAYCVLAGAAGFRIGLHLPNTDTAVKKHIEKIISMQKF